MQRIIPPFKRLGRGRTLARDTEGMTLIFFALGFLGLFAFLAIVVESGLVFLERRELQNTADAAALAGAQRLFTDPAAAEATAETHAAGTIGDLLTNVATVDGVAITSAISRNADSLFAAGSSLSFGSPEVNATATARIAAARLPGRGVSCVGVEFAEYSGALTAQLGVDVLDFDHPGLAPYVTILVLGSGQSNAGYVDIVGSENQNTRDCLREGSANPLQPVEETQTGVSIGQARQGLQDRLEAARDRNDNDGAGCYSWAEIVHSIEEADSDRDGITDDGTWVCNPLTNPDTAVMLMPIVDEDFTDDPGTMPVNLHDLGAPRPYMLGLFFFDAERTFADTSLPSWQFISQAQGHAELYGVFLDDAPTVIGPIPEDGSDGGIVDCDRTDSAVVFCFVQLVE
jgi:Flp pilus assembly protein TadG